MADRWVDDYSNVRRKTNADALAATWDENLATEGTPVSHWNRHDFAIVQHNGVYEHEA